MEDKREKLFSTTTHGSTDVPKTALVFRFCVQKSEQSRDQAHSLRDFGIFSDEMPSAEAHSEH